jgi:dynamin family protein
VALFGEFSAGKSSIVNLLVGRDILPTAVLSSTRRPTYVRYAPSLRIEAISEKGDREPISPDAIKALAREDISHFDIGMPNDLLRRVEVLDTPGFADPFHHPERTLAAVDSADICIWCTLATQAWCQSERQIWLSMPTRLRTSGILVATHIDTLAHGREQQRVRTRLKREAGEFFSDIVLLAVPDAMRALQADGRITDPDLWQRSGGSALIAALQGAAVKYRKVRSERKGVEFDEAAHALWTGTGFAPTDSAASTAPTQAGAPAAPAPETSEDPPDSAAAAEQQRFLARVMDTVPACLAAVWIDLAGRRVPQLRRPDTGEIIGTAILGKAITELFQSSNLQRIEKLFKGSSGPADDDTHSSEEIVIITDDCVGILFQNRPKVDRALMVVTDRTVDLGMVLARARRLLRSTDLLV